MNTPCATRPLSKTERDLASWMLEHGLPAARDFVPQLEKASATLWQCPCGCASFNFKIQDMPEAPPGVHILGDFVFGTEQDLAGAFIYSSEGTLSGLEVYGLAGDAPHKLPHPNDLLKFDGRPVILTGHAESQGAAPGNAT
jgi:hypothetical protein